MKRFLLIVVLLGLGGAFFFVFAGRGKTLSISKGSVVFTDLQVAQSLPRSQDKGTFRGEECEGSKDRPVGVMIAGDAEARPLSGISSADMTIEMPVTPDGITRSMGIFQCLRPQSIGSIRSARGPFLGVAKGYDLIFAHWGGERDSLSELHKGALDNLDALVNPFDAFYRKPGILMPHDGFASPADLYDAAKKLRYPVEGQAKDFFSFPQKIEPGLQQARRVSIPYIGQFHVEYRYDEMLGSYLRFRSGKPEIDFLTKKQVQAKNVLVVLANVQPTYSQYINVSLDGKRGKLIAFHHGEMREGFWEKKGFAEPLLFYNTKGEALALEPGATWVEVVPEEQKNSFISF